VIRGVFLPCASIAALAAGLLFLPEFFDLSSLLLTLGGSLAVIGFTYPRRQWRDLLKEVQALFKEKPPSPIARVEELGRLTRLYRLEGVRGLEGQEPLIADPFLKQGVALLVDLRKEEEVRARLEQSLAEALGELEISRQILQTLCKLLPAFGLIGTLIGMILLLRNFSAVDPRAMPGALSLAVLTTLYGAFFANVIVAPLAARLQAVAVEKELIMRLTADCLLALLDADASGEIESKLKRLSVVPLPPMEPFRGRDWLPAMFSTPRWR
jgi:chemotaxis protein MotA